MLRSTISSKKRLKKSIKFYIFSDINIISRSTSIGL